MSYTREQLKNVRQAKSNLEKIESKLELAIVGTIITLTIVLSLEMVAIAGTLAVLALSYVNLLPLIVDRIIGSAMLSVYYVISACSFSKTINLNNIQGGMSEEHKQILREYINSTKYKIKNYACTISSIGVFFKLEQD